YDAMNQISQDSAHVSNFVEVEAIFPALWSELGGQQLEIPLQRADFLQVPHRSQTVGNPHQNPEEGTRLLAEKNISLIMALFAHIRRPHEVVIQINEFCQLKLSIFIMYAL